MTDCKMKNIKDYPVITARIIGRRHILSGKASDDAAYLMKKDNYGFIGLADGQTNKIYSYIGGISCLELTAGFLEESGEPFLSDYAFVDEAQFALISRYRQHLHERAMKERAWPEDYASTIVALSFRPKTGEYVIAHLGDGCILAVTHDNKVIFLSKPENGMIPGSTWLTTSRTAMQHLRFANGNISAYKRIVMLTDGAECLCRGMNISSNAKEQLIHSTPSEIAEWLNAASPEDDASCIIMDV